MTAWGPVSAGDAVHVNKRVVLSEVREQRAAMIVVIAVGVLAAVTAVLFAVALPILGVAQ